MPEKLSLACYDSPIGNVGDDLNKLLWPRIFGDIFEDSGAAAFIGIGSVLDERFGSFTEKIVFGAGARSPRSRLNVRADGWNIRFVRGPNTARALRLSDDSWISDPAIVTPLFFPAQPLQRPSGKQVIGYVPYFRSDPVYCHIMCNAAGIKYIPITSTPERFLNQLLSCTHVFSEAMHGAILADAYRIPWVPCRMTNYFHEGETHVFKWQDWLLTLGLDPAFIDLPRPWFDIGASAYVDLKYLIKARVAARTIKKHIRADHWYLSETSILQERQGQIITRIVELKQYLANR